jgi:NADPH:quinone reductase-like Zn-dependent oxidoreductase
MQAYRIERFSSVDGIVLRSSEDPRPGLREILMRVRASSPNYRDLMVLKGGGRGPTKIGVIPLSRRRRRDRSGRRRSHARQSQ